MDSNRKLLDRRLWLTRAMVLAVFCMEARSATTNAAELPGKAIATIMMFFQAIDEGRSLEAIKMMSPQLVPGSDVRNGWKRQLSTIGAIHVADVAETDESSTASCVAYKVTLDVHLRARAPDADIPNYGWEEGRNTRWVLLCPDDGGAWVISSIGTGP